MNQQATYKELKDELELIKKTNDSKFLINLAGVIFIEINAKGIVTLVNKKACEVFGYTENEMLGKNWFEAFIPERIQKEILPIADKILRGEIESAEYYENPILTKSGEERLIYWHNAAIYNSEGDIIGHLSSGEDITERRKAEKSLQESKDRLSIALLAGNSGIWDWDIQKGEVFFDENYFLIAGYEPNAFPHTYEEWKKRVHPDDREISEKNVNDYISGVADEYASEFRFKTKDGDWMWMIGQGKITQYDNTGNPIRFIGTHTNIDNKKKSEQSLIERETQLRESNQTKDKLFSIIAHDLRSPFSGIIGFAGLLLENNATYNTEKRKKLIDTILFSSRKTYSLLQNLLEWSMAQTNKINYKPETHDLQQIFEDTIDQHQSRASAKEIQLHHVLKEKFEVHADLHILHTILRNLLSNAIKYTHSGGQITLNGQKDKDDSVIISVQDSGIGISEAQQPHIFKLADKQTTAGTENEKGSGLGLVLSKEFVEKHYGNIWVESQVGVGSTFYFSIRSKNAD